MNTKWSVQYYESVWITYIAWAYCIEINFVGFIYFNTE